MQLALATWLLCASCEAYTELASLSSTDSIPLELEKAYIKLHKIIVELSGVYKLPSQGASSALVRALCDKLSTTNGV